MNYIPVHFNNTMIILITVIILITIILLWNFHTVSSLVANKRYTRRCPNRSILALLYSVFSFSAWVSSVNILIVNVIKMFSKHTWQYLRTHNNTCTGMLSFRPSISRKDANWWLTTLLEQNCNWLVRKHLHDRGVLRFIVADTPAGWEEAMPPDGVY